MARKRCTDGNLLSSKKFTSLSSDAKSLWLSLMSNTDDEGFIPSANMVVLGYGMREINLVELVSAGYIYWFESDVAYVVDWHIHNTLNVRHRKQTVHTEEKMKIIETFGSTVFSNSLGNSGVGKISVSLKTLKNEIPVVPYLSEGCSQNTENGSLIEENIINTTEYNRKHLLGKREEKFEELWKINRDGSKKGAKARFMKLSNTDYGIVCEHYPLNYERCMQINRQPKQFEFYLSPAKENWKNELPKGYSNNNEPNNVTLKRSKDQPRKDNEKF